MSTTEYETFVGLPMPRVPESLPDRTRRPIVRTQAPGTKRFPFPVPDGWFIVAEARDLDPGQTMAFHVFGRDVVLFRTESGEPRMVDAYCAHLGAHLGVGGKVEGDCIRCPFHGWRYDGVSGRCTEIPYGETDRIPSQAKVRSYPTLERNHMIWAWHHGNDEPPTTPSGFRTRSRSSTSQPVARRWGRTTSTSRTSCTCTGARTSPTTSSR